jgi:hypothetical protein
VVVEDIAAGYHLGIEVVDELRIDRNHATRN